MNAIIAAMKLGTEGKTLSVLAGEMKTLSEQADLFVNAVGTIITDIVSGIANAASEEEKSEDGTDIDAVIGNIPKAFDKVKRKSADLNVLFDNLNTVLTSAFQGLAFMESLIEDLKQQHTLLDGVRESLEMFKGDDDCVEKAHSVLADRYTMEKERKVHKNITSADKTDIGTGAAELGDNIELF
jgi:methyl-accepting chemotaxis protein